MATQPTRQIASPIGTAIATDGRSTLATAKVANTATGDNELEIMFQSSGTVGNAAHDTQNQIIFPGCWAPNPALDARITFTSPGFANWTEFCNYFGAVASNVAGIRMQTDNTDNYISKIKQVEKQPTGKTREVSLRLDDFRVRMGGGGYAESLEIPREKLNPTVWSALQLTLSTIKAGSYVRIYLYMEGWNKMRELSALPVEII